MSDIKPRYLTKSRYKIGLDCPTKLFYTSKKEYSDKSQEDPFLAALASGGFQVGELARQYYQGGINIETLNYNEAEAMTADLMTRDQVIIFEPAVRYNNLFIRVDILVKNGNDLRLIEVKSKSFDSLEDQPFLTKAGKIRSTWKSYLHDVAFQKYVLEKAYPGFTVTSYLMLADKNAPCPTDRLNQKFRIAKDSSNRKGIKVSTALSKEDLTTKILIEVPTDDYVELIQEDTHPVPGDNSSFTEFIGFLSTSYEKDNKISPQIGSLCAKCEFKATIDEERAGLRSGFKECWMESVGWNENDFSEPSVLELWNSRKKDLYIASGKLKLKDIDQDDINIKPNPGVGMSASQRQWLQVEKVKAGDTSSFLDVTNMKAEMERWNFPLHHIDFETSRVAIPFNMGRKPYEGIFFQFSHHIIHEDGTIEHASQHLNAEPGIFPNYDCVRQLKQQLDNDNGTIFQYATHENTFLVTVYRQLMNDLSPPTDKEELCEFIKTITKHDDGIGKRCMVDLCDLVKKYYYNPATNGSNRIKNILPAILDSSSYLQEKYSKPIYGVTDGIRSLNYSNWTWVKFDENGKVIDPYKLLPPVFGEDLDLRMELISESDELNEGGAAMTAYCMLQFSEMSKYERDKIMSALLKYCELDTFAMVMIYEAWREMIFGR